MSRKERAQDFRSNFAASIAYELNLAGKWGAEADMRGNEVSRSIRAKYPPRKIGHIEKWLTSHKNKFGAPIFQFEPRLGGFIFNEGGRGVTFTHTKWCPFRLYIAGYVLMYNKTEKWTFKRWSKNRY